MHAVALISLLVFAQAEPQLTTLTTTLNVWDTAAEDLNGDGLADIAAFCGDDKSDPLQKHIAVFLARAPGIYPATPSHEIPVDPDSGLAFFAEVDGEAGKEIIVANAVGAEIYRYANARFEKFRSVAFTALFPSGSKEPLFLPRAAMDLDGDGDDEWLIPSLRGYEVRDADGLIRRLEGDIVSEIQPFANPIISHRLPAIHTFEQPGHEVLGIAFLSDTYADFSYGAKWSDHYRYRIPVNIDDKWDARTRMADIDNDGFPDLVVTQTQGTVKMKVHTQVYLAEAPFKYPSEPTDTFEMKGALASPYFQDVNGDEQLDLIFVNIPFGLRAFINFFLRNKFSVKAQVYLFDGTRFADKPSFETGLTLDAPDGRDQVAFTMGDFTGDGRLDAAFASDKDRFAVHLSEEGEFVSSRAWKTFDIPAFGVARTHDLDANDRDDIVIHHPSGEGRRRIDVLVF